MPSRWQGASRSQGLAGRADAASGGRAAVSRSAATGMAWTAGRMGSASESTSGFQDTRARAGGCAGPACVTPRPAWVRRSGDLRELDADDLAQLVVEAHGGAAVARATDVRDRGDRIPPAGRRQRRGDRDQHRAGNGHRARGPGEAERQGACLERPVPGLELPTYFEAGFAMDRLDGPPGDPAGPGFWP